MCDVVFITPNMRGSFTGESLGTLQLATILENSGMSCKILSFARIGNVYNFEEFLNNALEKIDAEKPKIISMYTRCDTYHISIRLAERIKARWNDLYVVFGGPQSDTTSEDTIACIPSVDFVCCGEGENTIYPFFSSLLRREPDLSIPGLVYRSNGTVVKNPRPDFIADLDSLPMIDFFGTYLSDNPEELSSIRFPIDVGRGCPFGCTYCSTKAFWGRKYRLKSPQRIYEEIKTAHDNFGVTMFKFSHDMFTFNRKTVIETCKLLRTLDFPVQWTCSARLDCLDPELIDIMVDAGMIRIFVGIESGSKRMQKLINKNLKLDKAIETLTYIKQKDIAALVSFVYGFPEEGEEDLSMTLSLMAKIMHNHCGHISAHLCTFLPKTELSERYKDELIRTNNYSNFTGNFAVDECKDLIDNYPMLFPQLMEYKTDLRTKLKHFALFLRVWEQMEPVYQYIAEQYPENSLIDMYFDFVNDNQETLEKLVDLPLSKATPALIPLDKLPQRLANDENYDLIKDFYRMYVTENSDVVKNGGNANEIYCFDPKERSRVASIRDYKRCVAVVSYAGGKTQVRKFPAQNK